MTDPVPDPRPGGSRELWPGEEWPDAGWLGEGGDDGGREDDRARGGDGDGADGSGWTPAARPVIGAPGALAELVPRVAQRRGVYRPSMAVDVAGVGAARLAVGSVKGAAHHEFGTVRQDSYGIGVVGGPRPGAERYAVVALADGVGEAPYSHLAADVACQSAVERVTRDLDAGTAADALDWSQVVADARAAIRRRAASSIPPEAQADEHELDREIARQVMSATLSVVVLETTGRPVRFTCARLAGDGYAYHRAAPAPSWSVLDAGKVMSDGVVDNAVLPLPRDPGEPRVTTGELAVGDALLVCTDGVGDVLGDARNQLGGFLARAWARPVEAPEFLRALDFVMADAIDDRTALVVW